jgi:hypothetical protein
MAANTGISPLAVVVLEAEAADSVGLEEALLGAVELAETGKPKPDYTLEFLFHAQNPAQVIPRLCFN